jgi:hypothetical protein
MDRRNTLGRLETMKFLRTMATSIAFPLAALTITLLLWAASAFGYEVVPGQHVDNWLTQGGYTALYALFAGLMIDTVRWLTATAWRSAAPRYQRRTRNLRRADACLAD